NRRQLIRARSARGPTANPYDRPGGFPARRKHAFMKRTERRHLKENELEILTRQAREKFDTRRRETTVIVALFVVVAAAAIAYFTWQQRVQTRAHALLAEAVAVQDARVGPAP